MTDVRNPNLQIPNLVPKVKIANYTITGNDFDLVFTNTGATGPVTYTAPTAVVGRKFRVLISTAQTVTVAPGIATDQFRGSAVGASVSDTTVGTYWIFHCIIKGVWEIIMGAAGANLVAPVTIAPVVGQVSLTVTGASGQNVIAAISTGGGTALATSTAGATGYDPLTWSNSNGTGAIALTNLGTTQYQASGAVQLFSGNLLTMQLAAAGNVSIVAPTAGTTLTVNALSGGQAYSATDGTVTAFELFGGSIYQFGTSSAHAVILNTSNNSRLIVDAGGITYMQQPTPTAINATATATIAQLLTLIITSTSAAATTITLPTGALTDAGIIGGVAPVNTFFDWSIINTGPNAVTLAAGTNHTIVGTTTTATATSSHWRTRKTASSTFVTYRFS